MTNIARSIAALGVATLVVVTVLFAKDYVKPSQYITDDGDIKGGEQSKEAASHGDKKAQKLLVVDGVEIKQLAKKLKASKSADYEPGERSFEAARVMFARGDQDLAEEKLKNIVNYYPLTPSAHEARRILGEINLDRLISDPSAGKKQVYTTQKGDSFLKIANKFNTSLNNLININGLSRLDRLHVNEEFLVMPLDFKLVIDMQKKTVTLMDGKQFVKDYYFKKALLPEKSGVLRTEISSMEAMTKSGSLTKLPNDSYLSARKIIVTKKPIIEIVDTQHPVDDAFQGVILDTASSEELALLLRRGNVVEIRY